MKISSGTDFSLSVCLVPDYKPETSPSNIKKIELKEMGLGEKYFTVNTNDSAEDITRKIKT